MSKNITLRLDQVVSDEKSGQGQSQPHEIMAPSVQANLVDLESFRLLAEAIPNLAWIAHPDGANFWYNKRWWDYTGTTPLDMEGWGWTVVYDPSVLPHVIEKWQSCLKDGIPFEMEFPLRGADGTFRWFLTRVMPVRDSSQKIINWFGTGTDIQLQKAAIVKAAVAENKLAQFLSSVPMILWATDKDGVVTLSEGKGLATLGLKPGETVGWDMLNSADRGVESVDWVKRALAGESFKAITHFGDRVVETSYEPLFDQQGAPDGMVAISNDITEKTKMETALQESKRHITDLAARLEAVLKNAPVALTEIDSDGIYTYSDGRYLTSLGLKPGVLVGQSCFQRHQDQPERLSALRRSFQGETVNTEVQNGENWVMTVTTPLRIENGVVKSLVALSIDITEQRRAEKSIATSEAKFKKVCESKMFGMLFWDKNGAITDANSAFLEMIGYTKDELAQGKIDWKLLTPPEYAQADEKAVRETIAKGYCEPYEKEYVRKDGVRIPIIISGATINDESMEGGLAIVIDVSAKQNAEREKAESLLSERAAMHASRTKSQFLANMSHEIRTPINGVLGMVSLLLDTSLQGEQREFAEAVRASADSLLIVVNDILDFSKIEAGKLEFENIDFDLSKVLHNLKRSFSIQAEKKGLKFTVDCPQTIRRFYNGDSGRLMQILNNLLSNAIKFTSKGSVTLRVSEDEDRQLVRFEVIDTGMGIPTESLNRMFTAFSQADSSTSRRFGGTGLGLAISKHLVEQMKGSIGVTTEEDLGSTFFFTVILKPAEKPVEEAAGAVGTFKDLLSRPMRVLIAEDNVINQKIALRYLENMGLRADAVANGYEVLDAIRLISYDLVLMDCQMPEMDGLEATRKIRASQSMGQSNIPIIAMTANAMRGDRERCIEAGMNDYVSKPVAAPELFLVLRKWLTKLSAVPSQVVVDAALRPESQLIDMSKIDSLRGLNESGDDSLFREIATIYLDTIPKAIQTMKSNLQLGKFEKIVAEAHQMKSASGYLGAEQVEKLAAEIETVALLKGAVEPLLEALEASFLLSAKQLESLLSRGSGKQPD